MLILRTVGLTAMLMSTASVVVAAPVIFSFDKVFDTATDMAPGSAQALEQLSEPGVSSTGDVAFRAIDQNGVNHILKTAGGVTSQVAQSGDAVPVGSLDAPTDTYEFFDDNVQIEGGEVAFESRSTLNSGSPGFIRDNGSGTQTLLLQRDNTVLPSTGNVITSTDDSEGYGINGSRFVAAVDDSAGTDAIVEVNGAFSTLVDSVNSTPPIGTAYSQLDDPYADRNGSGTVFRASTDAGIHGAILDGGTVEFVLTTGDTPTGAPGAVDGLSDPTIDSGNALFEARYFGSTSSSLVFYDASTGTTSNAVAAGFSMLPDGTIIEAAFNAGLSDETVFFEGRFGPSARQDVLVAWHDGMFTEIVREGGMLDGRIIEGLAINRHSVSGGFFGFSASFTDGTDAVYSGEFAPVPLPAALPLLLAGLGGLGLMSRRRRG